ncbi:hypothetical protein ABPG72_020184 [Tetrahymena utriculariae]
MTSQEWSDKGKVAFLSKNYNEALNFYNKAIELDCTKSVYFSNRARVYKLLGDLEKGLQDAEKSTELDVQNIKGHLLIGQIIAQMCQKNHQYLTKLDTCIIRLTKALTLCAGQKMQKNEKYLQDNIKRAKKLKWFIEQKQQQKEDQKIIQYLISKVEGQLEESEETKKKQVLLLKETLIEEENRKIPEYYLCKLTNKILQDPVTTKYCNTYEKKELDDYFKTIKSIRDPQNQQLLQNPSADILPNINLKKAIEEFIDLNPWAFEFKENETIQDMTF